MYKIYINEIPVFLIPKEKLKAEEWSLKPNSYLVRYSGKIKHLINYIDMCEKNPNVDKVIIYHHDYKTLKNDFKSVYTEIEAAGGLIENQFNEFLFIFRRGYWDLPKGKIEPTESKKEAAIREVEEETGISNITIHSKICKTRHTFKNKLGKRNIKRSHWYHMTATKQDLVPQVEEDISMAMWLTIDDILQKQEPIYKNIKDVIGVYQSTKKA